MKVITHPKAVLPRTDDDPWDASLPDGPCFLDLKLVTSGLGESSPIVDPHGYSRLQESIPRR